MINLTILQQLKVCHITMSIVTSITKIFLEIILSKPANKTTKFNLTTTITTTIVIASKIRMC